MRFGMPKTDELMSPTAFQEVFLAAASGAGLSQGRAALAMALAGLCRDPNGLVAERAPVLLSVLECLRGDYVDSEKPSRFARSIDWSAENQWPEGIVENTLSRERLALWLLREGADPLVRDTAGNDAWDKSVASNASCVLASLMTHSQCPAVEDLKARQTEGLGRKVPWQHQAASRNNLSMLKVLFDHGWEPALADRNGWLPLSWASHPVTVRFLCESGGLVVAQKSAVVEAWHKRKTSQKDLPVEEMVEALDRFAPMSNEESVNLENQKRLSVLLANKPTQKSYHFKGMEIPKPKVSNGEKDQRMAS